MKVSVVCSCHAYYDQNMYEAIFGPVMWLRRKKQGMHTEFWSHARTEEAIRETTLGWIFGRQNVGMKCG
jgi:hypothetical protein